MLTDLTLKACIDPGTRVVYEYNKNMPLGIDKISLIATLKINAKVF